MTTEWTMHGTADTKSSPTVLGPEDLQETIFFYYLFFNTLGARGSLVVKTLGYKLDGRGFETR
jgi:hypothetical protein